MKSKAQCYTALRDYIETVPLVDCHDHTKGCGPRYTDAISVVANSNAYFISDMVSACGEPQVEKILDSSLSIAERWPLLEDAWKRTCHTGYAQVVRRVLKRFYGLDELTYSGLESMAEQLVDLEDEKVFNEILDEARIVVRLEDCESWPHNNQSAKSVLDGSFTLPERSRLVIRITGYHNIVDYDALQHNAAPLNRRVTSLDEYVDVCRTIFGAYKSYGAVAFKDQSAYIRTLDYANPTRAEAEKVFNWLMQNPRRKASSSDAGKPLSDYLFHEFMRIAREMDLPVQIHTGHLAGSRGNITNANAIGLIGVLELHRDVRFDLFHANWPYDGELLFLGKNYPNVAVDFCWANIIDPVYCQRMFMQALSSVPHSKIHGYGSDFGGLADHAWAHASIARDNIAIALAEMVDIEYLSIEDAKEVAYGWLFGNANSYFRLGLDAKL